ncbi:MAG: glycosyltransferase [Planctomycetaceae bacterium]|nr:glycosyltransferase [Planctomycetales bacterium]MCB9921378.1 glycosyltransferase [Planctomycetaceae bacterium]
MNDWLLYLAIANLTICAIVGVPLFFGMRKIQKISNIAPTLDRPWPKVSVIVAARNEERDIEAGLCSLLQLDYDELEILVVNDRSTDRTGEILERIASEHPQLTVAHLHELPAGWLGKNHALYYGATRATGELLLFTDADVVMEPTVLRRAVAYMLEREIDHLPMLFEVRMPNWLLESFVVTFSVYLMTYCRPWQCPNPKRAGHIGIGGFNLVRADVYQKIGTHEVIRMRPDDDLKFGKLIKREGFRQELLNGAGLMYVPWYASIRELIVGLEKNAFSGVDYSISYAIFAGVCMLLFNVFPFVAIFITSGMTWYVYGAVVASLWAMGAWAAYHGRARISCCLGFPIAALMFVFIQWRAVMLNLWQDGISWRDTHYSLEELKANKL